MDLMIHYISGVNEFQPRIRVLGYGLYYQIFKRLAWDNVTLYEIISTTNEFTILVEEHLVDKAFSIIKGLKH